MSNDVKKPQDGVAAGAAVAAPTMAASTSGNTQGDATGKDALSAVGKAESSLDSLLGDLEKSDTEKKEVKSIEKKTATDTEKKSSQTSESVPSKQEVLMDLFEQFYQGKLARMDFVPCKLKVTSNCRVPLTGGSFRDFKTGQILNEGKFRVNGVFEMVRRGLRLTALHPVTGVETFSLSSLPYVGKV